MNKEQVTGRIKEAAGEVQEHVGRAIGSKEQELKGHIREQEGKAEKNVGDAVAKVDDLIDDAADKLKNR
ncbi:CsbD family protein [Caenimonas koreensis DSM 17982]|uniref:CsbD family protein n=1 Tax=Caenimonas koreensis DSM 17982 TaxID=1121255 RepID=A0A844B2L8_9BURK|nr:CsbD family protein [Caenimonas koreensis]MRD48988.1 CsbD family protein [Caenimonas koreensis DSM 17982]